MIMTGAASGIGRAVASLMVGGRHVIALDTDEAGLDRLEGVAHRVVGSVVDPEVCAEAVAAAKAYGPLGSLAHCAGIQRYGTAETTSAALWDEVIATNLTGAFHMCRAALPALREAGGSIVLVGSVQSLATQTNVAAYTAAKHGLAGLARSIAVDFAASGVRCNLVAPGAVRTPMLETAVAEGPDPDATWKTLRGMHPLGRVAEAEEVAQVIRFLLSDQASFVTGETVRVDGGLLSRIPGSPEDAA